MTPSSRASAKQNTSRGRCQSSFRKAARQPTNSKRCAPTHVFGKNSMPLIGSANGDKFFQVCPGLTLRGSCSSRHRQLSHNLKGGGGARKSSATDEAVASASKSSTATPSPTRPPPRPTPQPSGGRIPFPPPALALALASSDLAGAITPVSRASSSTKASATLAPPTLDVAHQGRTLENLRMANRTNRLISHVETLNSANQAPKSKLSKTAEGFGRPPHPPSTSSTPAGFDG